MCKKTPRDSHYARLRRQYRAVKSADMVKNHARKAIAPAGVSKGRIWLYGFHTTEAALKNPRRKIHRLLVTKNACIRLGLDELQLPCTPEVTEPRVLEQLLGSEAVHQGIMLETEPLFTKKLINLHDLPLIIILDQITDPHNVGAIMRSAVAFNAGALITTARHSPQESGFLAKAAAGALELIDHIIVQNLAKALETLHETGFQTFGLDSAGTQPLEVAFSGRKIALVLGAEGKGLRQKTKQMVSALARLDMPGKIKSLNVSNAAAIALYAAHSYLRYLE
ncbi:MAG: TrmH family [Candidatus Tokpelaia sp. JSC189]|nr:MAG: TrmH family [Candidatus Tokpelaia sp. JSC189]